MADQSTPGRRRFLRDLALGATAGMWPAHSAAAQQSGAAGAVGGAQGPRIWNSGEADDGSLHAIGNGSILVYGQGPHVAHFFGPPYTSPDLLRLELEPKAGQRLRAESRRTPHTATWSHQIAADGERAASFTDCVFEELPVLHRMIEIARPALALRLSTALQLYPLPAFALPSLGDDGAAWVIFGPRGSLAALTPYPLPKETYAVVAARGSRVRARQDAAGLSLEFQAGPSELFVAGGPSLRQAIEHLEGCLSQPAAALRERTETHWRRFAAGHAALEQQLPADAPYRERLIELIDSVAVLLKVQQAREGAETAGHYWPLGYARDHYGVSRAFLFLGHAEAAKAILDFQMRKFGLYGRVHTAYGIGVDSIRHQHENDEVEITGYTVQQAAEYHAATGDDAFIRQLFPMLDYCWQAQRRNLKADLLGFNGDESYIAGGLLPRSAIHDGSAEATMLFLHSGRWLTGWARAQKLWSDDYASEQASLLERVRRQWRASFLRGGRIVTNAPERASLDAPRFRHGVCEAEPRNVTWTLRTPEGRYVAPERLASRRLPAAPPAVYELPATALAVPWLGSDLVTAEELRSSVDHILAGPRPGPMPVAEGRRGFLGYEPGLLLNALERLGHPAQREFFEVTLGLLDSAGVWAEHYEKNGDPRGTRYRPWESAVNLEALLRASGPGRG